MVRYHHEHPSLVAIDHKNRLFATSFKLATAPQDMLLTYDLRLYQGDANIGLLHCNNHKSGIVYTSMVHNMRTIRHMYYQGKCMCFGVQNIVFVQCVTQLLVVEYMDRSYKLPSNINLVDQMILFFYFRRGRTAAAASHPPLQPQSYRCCHYVAPAPHYSQ